MAKNTITIDTRQLDRLANELKGFEKEVAEAARLALNRTIDYTVTQAGKLVTQAYAVKSKEVKESFKSIQRPSKSDLTAKLTSFGHTLSFAHFPYTPKTPKRSKRSVFDSMVMVTIKKPKGKIISKKGFVATTGAKSEDKIQYNVFRRLGKKRLPIAPIRTLSIPQMISNEGVAEKIEKVAQAKMDERLEHEIIRIMTSMQRNIKR